MAMRPWYSIGGAGGAPTTTAEMIADQQEERDMWAPFDPELDEYTVCPLGTQITQTSGPLAGTKHSIHWQPTGAKGSHGSIWVKPTVGGVDIDDPRIPSKRVGGRSFLEEVGRAVAKSPGLVGLALGLPAPFALSTKAALVASSAIGIVGYMAPAESFTRRLSIGYGVGAGIGTGIKYAPEIAETVEVVARVAAQASPKLGVIATGAAVGLFGWTLPVAAAGFLVGTFAPGIAGEIMRYATEDDEDKPPFTLRHDMGGWW